SLRMTVWMACRKNLSEVGLLLRRISDKAKSQSTERQNMTKSEKTQAASLVWFEIPADNPERATAFYSNLFGWKITPFPGGGDYWHIDTGGADDSPDGALKRRRHQQEPVGNYDNVNS